MNKMDGMSMDLTGENIAQLKKLFPEAVTEGKIDFDVLKALLGGEIEQRQEYYKFTWNGKEAARAYARTRSMGTLRPCVEESSGKDGTPGRFDSENLYIKGDNLEVLKLLQGPYHKRVKMIYIDPPYNTGKDFVYPDNFRDSLGNYKALTGQTDDEGKSTRANPETSGRYHTDWLNMMYPRLILARNLLADDGVIFISIDDAEVANLRKICDDVFGEENFVANIVWHKKYGAANDAKYMSDVHDHIIFYCKNKEVWKPNLFERPQELNQKYTNIDNDPRGPWIATNLSVKTYSKANDYIITSPAGLSFSPPPTRCWVVSKEKYEELLRDNRITFGKDGKSRPYKKTFLSEVQSGIVPTTVWSYNDAGHNIGAKSELRDLFSESTIPFDTPKPTKLISRMIRMIESSSKDDIILDFFSGSATTAHAVMQLNAEDGGNLKFIMVQLPEPCEEGTEAAKAGYKNICEIGKERIRRAARKIREELTTKNTKEHENKKPKDEKTLPLFGEAESSNLSCNSCVSWSNQDFGFKVFKLDTSNLLPWNPNAETLKDDLYNAVDNVLADRTTEDLLYEILLKCNLPLTLPIDEKKLGNNTVYVVGMGALAICLDKTIPATIAEEIVKLRDEYAPIVPMQVVFRDNGFDDVSKTNALQILKQAGFEEKSIQTI